MKDCIRLGSGTIAFPDGTIAFRSVADYFEAKAHVLGPDHIEITAKRPYLYHEGTEEDLTKAQQQLLKRILRDGPDEPTEEQLAERKALSLKVAANRAKTRVRKLCKTMGADTLLTMTYRANQTDLPLMKAHIKAFVRRCRKFWPDFSAVAAYEPQQRGAWHCHMAMANIPQSFIVKGSNGQYGRVKSYNLIRDQWRRVTGELGGNIDVSRRKRSSKKSPAAIAAYLSKYIMKAFETGAAWSNRYTRFGGENPPRALDMGRFACARDMLVQLYGLVDEAKDICQSVYSAFGDWFFLAAESSAGRKKGPSGGL